MNTILLWNRFDSNHNMTNIHLEGVVRKNKTLISSLKKNFSYLPFNAYTSISAVKKLDDPARKDFAFMVDKKLGR